MIYNLDQFSESDKDQILQLNMQVNSLIRDLEYDSIWLPLSLEKVKFKSDYLYYESLGKKMEEHYGFNDYIQLDDSLKLYEVL